MAPLCA